MLEHKELLCRLGSPVPLDAPILSQGTNQARRGSKRQCVKHEAHRPHTDAVRILLTSREPSDGQERNQDNEDNPNINSHQSRRFVPALNGA
jgi:hypothetical protein